MGYVIGFPCIVKGDNSIWVIVDRLTKMTHFIPISNTHTMDYMAAIYIKEIVRLYGALVSITSDRDSRFVSKFWQSLQRTMGTRLNLSTVFHSQTDEQLEKKIQTLENLLREVSITIVLEKGWRNRDYRAMYCTGNNGENQVDSGSIESSTRSTKSIADANRRELDFQEGNWVFLKISPMKGVMRFGKKGKLNPRYVGPFEILEKIGPVAYRLALTLEFANIHDVFHVSMLRKYVADPTHVLEQSPIVLEKNLQYEERPVRIMDTRVRQLRGKVIPLIKV
ncbi:uncharacterized protein LOC130770513 [Actinidia eriantha]|uniref:uncharacterized protein LOC130770513 n=1 Tax=Actinidia eriantha TaxID=165200 RepID=UPI0025844323|nr:uncharacterized protein LOC130770513 [Actinidia eriantha]